MKFFGFCYFNPSKNKQTNKQKPIKNPQRSEGNSLTLHTHSLPPYMKFLGLLFSCWLKKKKKMGRQIQKCDIKIYQVNYTASFWWALKLNSKWKYVSITSSCFNYHGRHSHCLLKWGIWAWVRQKFLMFNIYKQKELNMCSPFKPMAVSFQCMTKSTTIKKK